MENEKYLLVQFSSDEVRTDSITCHDFCRQFMSKRMLFIPHVISVGYYCAEKWFLFSVIYDKIKLREKIETVEILGHWPAYVNFT